MDKNKIANNIRNIRGNASKKEFADTLNLSISAVSLYESGKRIPKDDIKIRIAQYAHKSVEEIFFS